MVEDNPGDVRLVVEAFKCARVLSRLSVTVDGMDALAFLRREGQYTDVPRPDLILLDLNMPKKDGREVLAEIKADKDLRRIPVIVLTTSRDEEDVLASYSLHANCYISKPDELEQFIDVARSIEEFWTAVAELPMQ
jgi:CheY-like chemotaxis protein